MEGDDSNAGDDPVEWEWTPGDQEFHVDILDAERARVPEANDAEGQRDAWHSSLGGSAIVLDLKGRSLEEVKEEALRVKAGQTFTSFDEFNHCLDSFCVLRGLLTSTRRGKSFTLEFAVLGCMSKNHRDLD